MKVILLLFFIVLLSVISTDVFAQKTVSIHKTVDVDKKSLINSISSLGLYSQILPDYIQSSKLIGEDTAKIKIGLDWITIDTEIKFVESSDQAVLEVVSGDFKETKLYVTMSEKHTKDTSNKTDVSAKIDLQTNWYMGIMTSFVSDEDIQSMLYTSLDGLVKHAKNPQTEKIKEEQEKFCILGLCF